MARFQFFVRQSAQAPCQLDFETDTLVFGHLQHPVRQNAWILSRGDGKDLVTVQVPQSKKLDKLGEIV
jgi:hypothetical protein